MRTTLTIDDALLEAAVPVAKARGADVGEIISEWARRGLQSSAQGAVRPGVFPVFPTTGQVIPSQRTKELLDDEGLPARR